MPTSKLVTKTVLSYNWTELRPFLPSRVLKFFTSSFNTLFVFPRSSCPWECLYLEKLPVAHREGRSFCLTWTLQDPKGTFLALHRSSEGWLENYQIFKKRTSKMKTYNLILFNNNYFTTRNFLSVTQSYMGFFTTDEEGF